jgi:hypothetical protein
MDSRFVGAARVTGEFGAQHVEPHNVFRCLDEVSETVQEEGAAKAFGKIIAEKNDSTRPGMRIEGVDRFPGESAIGPRFAMGTLNLRPGGASGDSG